MEELVDELKQPRSANQTPLAELLGKVSGKPEFWGKVKDITVFSDMRQNTRRHSVFPRAGRKALDVDVFASYLRELIDERYRGVEIKLFFVENDTSIKSPTEPQLQEFWTESLSRIGAKPNWRVN